VGEDGRAAGSVALPPAAPHDLIPPSLLHSFSWAVVGNVVYAGSLWAMLVVVARLASARMVGAFALGMAVAGPLFMLTNLQLRPLLATDARREYGFPDYLGLRVVAVAAALAVVAGAVWTAGYGDVAVVVLAVALMKALEAVSDVLYGLWQRHDRLDLVTKSLVLRGCAAVAALWATLASTGSTAVGIAAVAAAWALVLALRDLPLARGFDVLRPSFHPATLRALTRLSIPVGVVAALTALTYNVPRYFVEHELGTGALGYFAAVSYAGVAGLTFVNAIGDSASGRLGRAFASGDRTAFARLAGRIALAGAALGALGVAVVAAFGERILELLYGPRYGAYERAFLLTMVAAAMTYAATLLGYALIAARRLNVQPALSAAVVVTTGAACAVLVPRSGVTGAAWALVAGAAVHLLGSAALAAAVTARGDR
jgi:O-antigen/teichoic acid export membrane protein